MTAPCPEEDTSIASLIPSFNDLPIVCTSFLRLVVDQYQRGLVAIKQRTEHREQFPDTFIVIKIPQHRGIEGINDNDFWGDTQFINLLHEPNDHFFRVEWEEALMQMIEARVVNLQGFSHG